MTDNFNNFANITTLKKVLDMKQFETMAKINCMRIGIIQSVNGLEAECLITNKKTVGINDNGLSEVKDYPAITARIYYMGNTENNINYPLLAGQPCLLLFNDREFYSYFATGEISTCINDELHSLNYAICVPLAQPTQDGNFNVYSKQNVNITSDNKDLTITAKNITLNADTITLTSTNDTTITANKIYLNGQLYINNTLYTSHTHSNGNQGNPTGSVIV